MSLARVLGAPLRSGTTEIERRDAIVVLGARLANDRLTPVLVERARVASELYARGAAPRVIATGGVTGSATRSEAEAIAEAIGVPDVELERHARTTAENARFVAAMLPANARVWLVTQPFHTRRAEHLFRRTGLDARAWLMASDERVRWIVREYAAWLKLLVRRV